MVKFLRHNPMMQVVIDFASFSLAHVARLGKNRDVTMDPYGHLPTQAQRYGPDAWLVTYASQIDDVSLARAAMIRQQLANHPPAHLQEVTFAYTTVLLEYAVGKAPAQAPTFFMTDDNIALGPIKKIAVCYDGEDLDRVAAHAKMSRSQVIELHSSVTYCVHCLGFAPGFAYLSGLPEALHTPRLATPRLRIPAGSVAIGGAQTGIYPLATSGGWNLIGRTDQVLFHPSATKEQATYLHPGDRLRFEPQPLS
jgi:KipI family sensor histidine kinase inhibitor